MIKSSTFPSKKLERKLRLKKEGLFIKIQSCSQTQRVVKT